MTAPSLTPWEQIPGDVRRLAEQAVENWARDGAQYVATADAAAEYDRCVGHVARAILAADQAATLRERARIATFVETMAVARGYAGGQPRGPDLVRRTNPSSSAQALAAAIRAGG